MVELEVVDFGDEPVDLFVFFFSSSLNLRFVSLSFSLSIL